MDARALGLRIRRLRTLRGLSQRELADFADHSERWAWSLERGDGRATLELAVAQRLADGLRVDLAVVLGVAPMPAHLDVRDETKGPGLLAALEIEPDDKDIESAVLRLRRSYSTTPPAQLNRRVDLRLRQVRRLLSGQARTSRRRSLLEAAAWLALLRGTVQVDLSECEAAETSVHVARQLAREIGHREVEAWTWETSAWMAATDGRPRDALEMAGVGIEVAPRGGFGLVAATLQRARIRGALGDEDGALRDLLAGQQALGAAGEATWPDDHYSVDPAKAAFFVSGTMAQLRRPVETIEHAVEVVRASEDPRTRNFWPMRVANARVEWATALADLGDEDAAAAMAARALDRQWFRPDTERRMRMLLGRMRDADLRAKLAERLHELTVPGSKSIR